MATAQPGIFAQGTRAHHHLELDVRPDAAPGAIAAALSRVHDPAVTAGGLNLVIGCGPDVWRSLAPGDAPADLRPFAPIEGIGGHRAPTTQHDVWIWVHGDGPDVVFDGARLAAAAFVGVATLAAEQPCFVYRDSRDLTGFIDGTENPPVDEAPEVALIPEGLPGAGGSYAITMRWVHDLAAFHALPEAEQEAVIGRTKPDSVELGDDVKPPTAHIARTVVEDADGAELEIYRRSTPFGTVGEHGLYFVAFSADPTRFDRMLARMFGTSGDGLHDRLIEFSTAVSGASYFVPSLKALAALG